MANRPSPMVMRSVYLPEDMDLRLRQIAFTLRRPKADLIRAFVGRGLREMRDIDRVSSADLRLEADRIFGGLQDFTETERAAFAADTDRFVDQEGEAVPAQAAVAAE